MLKRFRSSKSHNKGEPERKTSDTPSDLLAPSSNGSIRGRASSDIIFVHGLGGHSHRTWTKNRDPAQFWPGSWLPFEPDVSTTRILTFGYNATWKGSTKSISTITDFAKELLNEMRFARDMNGSCLDVGGRPIIFVVHSMGGLVVKKAYLLGLHDETGTNLAETLNRIVSATMQASKSFISDLNKSSVALEELNEQFRHIAPGLSIWSFYETLATRYPTEISRPLQADHNSICKFDSPSDANYILWYSAPPASGKSVLTAFLVDHLRASRRRLFASSVESLGLESNDPMVIWRNTFERILFGIDMTPGPVYWVIDALDECDSPKTLLDCLASLSASRIPVTAIILSRHTDSLAVALDRAARHLLIRRMERLGHAHSQHDIAVFVDREMEHLPGTAAFREKLQRKILSRSEGNFLWTKLVLSEIMQCHTEESIDEVLEETPDDMTELYQRMERNLRPLSVTEFSRALQPEFTGFLDLRRTIATAEYFKSSNTSEFPISNKETHAKIFRKIILVLEDPNLRAQLVQHQHALQASDPFVFYAAVSWPYHLGHCTSNPSELLDAIVRFLRSTAVLSWVQILAVLRRLDVLAKASKVLNAVTKSIRKRDASRNPMLHRLTDLERLDSWAVDLLKLVGKFGRQLTAYPNVTSIVRLHAVLASTNIVHIWDSTNFAEIGKVVHGEAVTAMALTDNGSKLATYGLKTTKLWAVPSGIVLATAPSPPYSKAVSMAFSSDNSRLLAGSDDNAVRTIQCSDFEQGWAILNPELLKETSQIDGPLNSPMCLAFSPDGDHVGASASTEGRMQRRPSTNWFAVDRFTWNPITGHIIGIYRDGIVFKWHPLSNETAESHRTADEVAAAPTGKMFATSSSDGAIRLWNLAYFTVVYQLSSEDLVSGLVFSPDSRRFYDLRGGSVNAWEPNCLARALQEGEEHMSDTNSEDQSVTAMSKFSEARVSPRSYCVGYEDGGVLLFRDMAAEGIEIARFYNFLDVRYIAWSADGGCVACADLAGEVQVVRLELHNESGHLQAVVSPQVNLEGSTIQGLIFSPDSKVLFLHLGEQGRSWVCRPDLPRHLLAFGDSDVLVYDWDAMKLTGSLQFLEEEEETTGPGRTWKTTTDGAAEQDHGLPDPIVHVMQSASHIVLSVKSPGQKVSFSTRLFAVKDLATLLETKDLVQHEDGPITLPYKDLSMHIGRAMHTPLGVIFDSDLAFLDDNLWVHTIPLTMPEQSASRHYFIPRDWVGPASLQHCRVSDEGTLFWPMENQVVMAQCVYTDARRSRRKPNSTPNASVSSDLQDLQSNLDDDRPLDSLDIVSVALSRGMRNQADNRWDLSSEPRIPNVSVEARAAIDGFYTYFFPGHPFVLPKIPFLFELDRDPTSLADLASVMALIGSLYLRDGRSQQYRHRVERAMSRQLAPSGFSVQVLMLVALVLEWSGENDRAEETLTGAKSMALSIGLHQQPFAAQNGRQTPTLEESWRRTWWELYVVDALFAGIRHLPTFTLWSIDTTVDLPAEESDYIAENILTPRTLTEYDDRGFDQVNVPFSSFTYLIDAARILGTSLAAGDIAGGSPIALVKNAEANIMSWDLHLPPSKRDPVRPNGSVDEVLFRAHMRGGTLAQAEITTPLQHNGAALLQAIRAAIAFIDLLTVPASATSHSPFVMCMGSMAMATHMSACELLLRGDDYAHARDRVRVFLGILRAFEGIWPQANKWSGEMRLMAKAVFENRDRAGYLIADPLGALSQNMVDGGCLGPRVEDLGGASGVDGLDILLGDAAFGDVAM
ncbi:Calcium channel YVC1 [Purpureocillium lavendulum]|uniref:Calcium channel YVC1 n=1 Tax=Purpureocillium lavendulum TaxID=1247861 RepID=A0AB34G7G6_9HYPO|nr:Calcium channel YVC1 [Purpureocillium lavendulum]